jgi:hypothetical protein
LGIWVSETEVLKVNLLLLGFGFRVRFRRNCNLQGVVLFAAKKLLILWENVKNCREFVTCVRSIKILSPSEVTQISQEQLEILNTGGPVHVQQRSASSNSEDACTQTSPSNLASGGSLDH